ncbi:MAG: SEL1-like repeat protein [Rhizobiales bacterium]|nr:SEL1-like repeat protein [Hyphomicrobiales bacterium]
MKPGIPWSVKGIGPEVREAAKHAARRSGMTLGEWLNSVILDQSEENELAHPPAEAIPHKDFSDARRMDTAPSRHPRHDDTTIRLEDIAQQLSRLARREQESAAIRPYEAPAQHQDAEALHRMLARVDNNERQAVEAFTAVNERLSVLGRQIAMAAQQQKNFDKPEDVPGFNSLETAIRNVVDHLDVSERRTRDTLKSMQDRLGDMAQRASSSASDDVLQAAPALASLETRLNDLANRVHRSEEASHSGLSDLVRQELSRLADRIERVSEASEDLSARAQSAAVSMAHQELRAIESRILGLLNEAQAALGGQASGSDLQRLRAEIANLNQRIDEAQAGTASERDVDALRAAVEQLSARVVQAPDLRPLTDMDRRIAELDHRLGEALRQQGDGAAAAALEHQLSAVNDRIGRAEQQLGHFDTIERAITQLFESLEQNRALAQAAAEETASRVTDRILATQSSAQGPSPEMQALQEGLRAVRESATSSDQRNQETLEAVHETLEQIVNKLAELETAAAGHQLAVNMAQQAKEPQNGGPDWQAPHTTVESASSSFLDPADAFQDTIPEAAAEPAGIIPTHSDSQPQAVDFSLGDSDKFAPADDFIAAARRAAQAAATQTNVLHPEIKPALKPGANRRFSLPFRKRGSTRQQRPEPLSFSGGKLVPGIKPAVSNDSKRRKLVILGLALLAAVSAFTFNLMKPAKPLKQSTSIETIVEPAGAAPARQAPAKTHDTQAQAVVLPEPTGDGSGLPSPGETVVTDSILTGALPAKNTGASLASIVAEPGVFAENADESSAEAGSQSLREAATRGDATAQFIIASRYLDGQNVQQDFTKAAYWYQLAAARGLAPAQYRLATLFERGKGVPQDVAAALLWYERAASAGNVKAMHNAAVIAAGNQVGTPNYDEAFRWFRKAAERGLKDSQFNLAVLYERGLGTKIDLSEALFWYTMAGNQGDQDAARRAGQLVAALAPGDRKTVTDRAAAWNPDPAADDANVVAVANPDWNAPLNAPITHSATAQVLSADPVLTAQQLLSRLGFNVGEPDGKMGAQTVNAIRLFQLQSGLAVTGEPTPDLILALQAKAS